MNNAKIKRIGQITIMNSRLIGGPASTNVIILEKILPLLPDQDLAFSLLHDLEQLQAALQNLQPALDLAMKDIESDD